MYVINYLKYLLFNYHIFTIMNKISVDLSSNLKGLSWKFTCMNHILCNFYATYLHTIYVTHSISIRDHCLGLVTVNVMKIPLVHV